LEEKKKKYISRDDALKKLQRYCAYQDRCHQEVRRKLLNLGIYGDELEGIMVDLIADGFLDEERFARSFARGRFRTKQWGRLRILRELKQRQITDYCQRKAMEEIDGAEYEQTLVSLLQKKNRQISHNDAFLRQGKLADFVIRRGFEPELVWEKVRKLVNDVNSG